MPEEAELVADPGPMPDLVNEHSEYTVVREVQFQRRKRFKRAIASMREGSLLPAEQISQFGSEEGAQQILEASEHLAREGIQRHVRAHQRKLRVRAGHVESTSDALVGKRGKRRGSGRCVCGDA